MGKPSEAFHKVTLSTGKEVLLRDMTIKFQNLAMKAVGNKAGENQILYVSLMQQELLKILIAHIDGSPVSGKDLENLDSVLSYAEYSQLMQVVKKISGGDQEAGELQTEIVTTGGK